jgi:hypothetical protein
MTDKIFVTPLPGRTIYNFTRPDNRILSPDGEWVENDPQWLRYRDEGSVIIGEPQPKTKLPKKGDD